MSAFQTWCLVGALIVVFTTVMVLLAVEDAEGGDGYFEAEDRDWLHEEEDE